MAAEATACWPLQQLHLVAEAEEVRLRTRGPEVEAEVAMEALLLLCLVDRMVLGPQVACPGAVAIRVVPVEADPVEAVQRGLAMDVRSLVLPAVPGNTCLS